VPRNRCIRCDKPGKVSLCFADVRWPLCKECGGAVLKEFKWLETRAENGAKRGKGFRGKGIYTQSEYIGGNENLLQVRKDPLRKRAVPHPLLTRTQGSKRSSEAAQRRSSAGYTPKARSGEPAVRR